MNSFMESNLNMPLSEVLEVMQNRIMSETTYFGVTALKSPIDFWVYQEIIFRMKPDFIVEIGNNCGGSTLALAHMCDLLGSGKVIGLDICHDNIPDIVQKHPRIKLIEGDACESFGEVNGLLSKQDRVLIIEDSSHTYENTLNVLRTFSPLTKSGDYFIVEDGICYHGLDVGPQPGPYEAVETFISENPNFEIDRSKESFLVTWNPKGYLKRR